MLLKSLSSVPPVLESALPMSSLEVSKGNTCDYALAENWSTTKKIFAVENEKEYYPAVIINDGEKLVNVNGNLIGCEIASTGRVVVYVENSDRIQDEDCLAYTIHHNMTLDLQQLGSYSFTISPYLADNIIHTYSTDHRCVVQLNQSGTLLDHVGIDHVNEICYLKVTGEVNGTDMRIVGKMPNLRILDLSEAQIVEGGMSYYGDNCYTKKNLIGEYFFAGQQLLLKVLLPKTATTIERQAFLNKKSLIDVLLPETLTTIGEYAFYGSTGLKTISLPKTVTKIESGAFGACSFEDVEFLCPIVGNWFEGMISIKNLQFGSTVTTISDNAFKGCKGLSYVSIQNGTETIGASAFQNCTGLNKIIIPASTKSIGESAFSNCTALSTIVSWNPVPPTIKSSTFDAKTKETANLDVPIGSSTAYWLAPYWGDFQNIIGIDPSGIEELTYTAKPSFSQKVRVYTLSGQLVYTIDATQQQECIGMLPSGIYIINGKKVVLK